MLLPFPLILAVCSLLAGHPALQMHNEVFGLVDFIDSPGLADGKLQYPFPVNDVIGWLADRVDLVFVFFDPHGQATCERTMDIVKVSGSWALVAASLSVCPVPLIPCVLCL